MSSANENWRGLNKHLLEQVSDLHEVPQGAYNIRKNGAGVERRSTANIEIVPKTDKPGIDIIIKPGTKNESVHIPVIITKSDIKETVYNTFEVGAGADVLIVAGCGIHNAGKMDSAHNGVHEFIVHEGARVRYVEKHYGEGKGDGQRIMNPQTILHLEKNASVEMETIQIRGIDSTMRQTDATLAEGAHLKLTEKLLTHGKQLAESKMEIEMTGADSSVQVISRSVAQEDSRQTFYPRVTGSAKCHGHVQCDAIIMDNATVEAVPAIIAQHSDAQLIHEAAIGKIAGEQIAKLMTLGLTQTEAEERILNGFLK